MSADDVIATGMAFTVIGLACLAACAVDAICQHLDQHARMETEFAPVLTPCRSWDRDWQGRRDAGVNTAYALRWPMPAADHKPRHAAPEPDPAEACDTAPYLHVLGAVADRPTYLSPWEEIAATQQALQAWQADPDRTRLIPVVRL